MAGAVLTKASRSLLARPMRNGFSCPSGGMPSIALVGVLLKQVIPLWMSSLARMIVSAFTICEDMRVTNHEPSAALLQQILIHHEEYSPVCVLLRCVTRCGCIAQSFGGCDGTVENDASNRAQLPQACVHAFVEGFVNMLCSGSLSSPLQLYYYQGLRSYLRVAMRYTSSRITVPYVVHELKDVPYLHGDFVRAQPEFSVRIGQDSR